MKKTMLLLLTTTILSCGFREGVTVAEPKSYLAFTGNTTGAIVNIDGTTSFPLDSGSGTTTRSDNSSDPGQDKTHLVKTHYQITPGKHHIQVVKSGAIVIDRELLLGDGITREISVP